MSDQFSGGGGADGAGEPDRLVAGTSSERVSVGNERPRRARGRLALAAAAVLGIGVLGTGAWAVSSFLATSDQPAQVLPADTLLYASVDLDPGGEQKIEALRMADKFPALRQGLGIDPDDDLRQVILDAVGKKAGCDLDFDEVEPWLGSQAAVAAVPGDSPGAPEGVVVVAVTDRAAAADDEAAIRECAGDQAGIALTDDWLVLANDQDEADAVAGSDDYLADDENYRRWTGEVGDPGIVTAYAAPEAAAVLADALGASAGDTERDTEGGWFSYGGPPTDSDRDAAISAAQKSLDDFQGAALTLRFADGTLEADAASGSDATNEILGAGDTASLVSGLPGDTAAALGLSLADGWTTALTARVSETLGNEEMNDLLANVADTLESALGDSAVLSVGSGLNPAELQSDPSDAPVGLTVRGDTETVESSIDDLLQFVPRAIAGLGTDSSGDRVALSPSADYRAALLGGASGDTLGDSDSFRSVVPDADGAAAIGYLDLDAVQSWLPDLVGSTTGSADGSGQTDENLEPLRALGLTATRDGDVSRLTLRLSTD